MAEQIPAPHTMPHRRRWWFTIITLVGTASLVCASAVAAEFAARYRERHRSTPPDYMPSMYYPHRRLRYGLIPNLDYYGWFRINSMGFRGREFSSVKPVGSLRVICLGGSTTFDIGSVGKDRPWPEVMEAQLRRRLGVSSVEVMNLGIPGATSLDSLIDLQMRALALHPDVVVVYQGHNDFIYSIPPLRPPRTDLFPLEDPPRGAIKRWLTLHSLLYAKGEDRFWALFGQLGHVVPDHRRELSDAERMRSIEQGLEIFRSNLISVAAIARANGIVLVLPEIVFPSPVADSDESRCRVCDGLSETYGGLAPHIVASMLGRYNEALAEVGQEEGVRYVATDGFVPSADRFYHDSVHFSPAGSVRMGESLADSVSALLKSIAPTSIPLSAE